MEIKKQLIFSRRNNICEISPYYHSSRKHSSDNLQGNIVMAQAVLE